KQDPDYLPARLNLARALDLAGSEEEAAKRLSEALGKQPTNGVVLTRLVELLMEQGKKDAAIAAAERAPSAEPGNLGINVGLFDLDGKGGAKDKALALAREQSRTDPNNAQLIAARARAEIAAGLHSEAADSYRRLTELAPSQTAYRRQLA